MSEPETESTELSPEETSSELAPVRLIQGYAVPEGALRVKVLDEKSKTCWRKIDEVRPTDSLELKDGVPVYMNRPVGRPPQPKDLHEALPPKNQLVGDLIKIKAAHYRTDPIIQIAEQTPESPEVLDQVMVAIAEEASSLRFERMEAERQGEECSTFSMRRVQALKALGDTWLKRKEQISQKEVDLESTAFQALFGFIVETFTHSMSDAGIRGEQCDSVISTFAKKLDETWKNEARSRMKT